MTPLNTLADFYNTIDQNSATGCWEWQGGTVGGGYGRTTYKSKRVLTHRLMYELRRGPIPEDLVLDHLCRNRKCCNPDHLEAVTNKENILRGESPCANNARRTHCHRGHALEGSNVYSKAKTCRMCQNFRHSTSRRERRQAAGANSHRGGLCRRICADFKCGYEILVAHKFLDKGLPVCVCGQNFVGPDRDADGNILEGEGK